MVALCGLPWPSYLVSPGILLRYARLLRWLKHCLIRHRYMEAGFDVSSVVGKQSWPRFWRRWNAPCQPCHNALPRAVDREQVYFF